MCVVVVEEIKKRRYENMLWNVIFLIIGIMVLGAGLYYLVKEKSDPESRKIYSVVSVVGVVVVIGAVIKFIL